MSPQKQHFTTQRNPSYYTPSSPSTSFVQYIHWTLLHGSLSLDMECAKGSLWTRNLYDAKPAWYWIFWPLGLWEMNVFLLTLQSVVFCNSNIKQTKTNPFPTVFQSKTSLLEIYPGSPTENTGKENWLEQRESTPELLPLLAIGHQGSFIWGFMEQLTYMALGITTTQEF